MGCDGIWETVPLDKMVDFIFDTYNEFEGKKCKDPILGKIGSIILQKYELDNEIEKMLG